MKLEGLLSDNKLMEEISKKVDSKQVIEYIKKREDEGFIELDKEAIILKIGRPSYLIENNTFDSTGSETWSAKLNKNLNKLNEVIPSVGRVELTGHLSYDWVGTAWLISDNVIITNRHVAEVFITETQGEFSFKTNANNKKIKASIDFKEEYKNSEESVFKIVKVLHIERDPGPDVAFFQIENTSESNGKLPNKITLSNKTIDREYDVAAIGYPAYDSRNDSEVMKEIFQNVYDSKRLSPGILYPAAQGETTLKHDCSTLGGSSGSVIVDINTGMAMGLHFAGKYLDHNYAVSSSKIVEIMDQVGIK
ncbi:serine protease [Paenibacillus barcinonensis]|uniref:trypsin-like serine peptidase n=1 Tax=Paenibacillus TaxID=44249 RepID=UPI001C111075|nr:MULTISPECIES: serine protease [Paenibacillus]MBU5350901.1 serine protease [Paenibacillus barcinonensis]MDM5278482.1 serine protease [Paenibacillus silvae]